MRVGYLNPDDESWQSWNASLSNNGTLSNVTQQKSTTGSHDTETVTNSHDGSQSNGPHESTTSNPYGHNSSSNVERENKNVSSPSAPSKTKIKRTNAASVDLGLTIIIDPSDQESGYNFLTDNYSGFKVLREFSS